VKNNEIITKEIFAQAKNGESKAFDLVMRAYSSFVYSLAVRLSGSTDEAKDILQQTFLKLYFNIHKLEHRANLSTWLRKTCLHTFIDEYRKGKKRTQEKPKDIVLLEQEKYKQIYSDLTAERIDLEFFLHQLKKTERLVVWLYSVEGYKHKEIAEKLNISISNSKQILRRSIKKLGELTKHD